jgi:hypothetical protein
MRTTLDIDEPILQDLKRLRRERKKPLGRIVSDLLAAALARDEAGPPAPAEFRWHARPMGARLDLADQEAVYDAMERPARRAGTP